MGDGGGRRRYLAGDVIRMELSLEHSTNLARVFVAFSHGQDPLTEFYFETTSFPAAEAQASGSVRRSRVRLESPVPPETVPGVYSLTRVNAFSVGGKLSRMKEEALGDVLGAGFEIAEEPARMPTLSSLDFLD